MERAEILFHVQDAASPIREEQKTQVERVLAELAVSTKRVIQVLNKIDLVPPPELPHLSNDRDAIPVWSLQRTGLEQLLIAMDAALVVDPIVESKFRIPQSQGSILAALASSSLSRAAMSPVSSKDAASAYKVDTDAIAAKVRQDFTAREEATKGTPAKSQSREENSLIFR
ncbi:hypothetical protein JAO29_02800 [Edaphobacter sp. HDX4]|uniref:hypothetical protein n=1 Tax=Edaphobacter sp. HDX4 TaxID=2794064 RepID=UPI002FE5F923